MLAAIPDPGIRRLATIAVHTGLREGELLGLTQASIDWERRELHVTQALQRLGAEYRLVESKSATSLRTVPLTAVAVEALSQEWQAQRLAQLAAGADGTNRSRG